MKGSGGIVMTDKDYMKTIDLLIEERDYYAEKLENAEAEVAECLIFLKNLHDLCDWNGISSTWMDDAAKIIGLEGVE